MNVFQSQALILMSIENDLGKNGGLNRCPMKRLATCFTSDRTVSSFIFGVIIEYFSMQGTGIYYFKLPGINFF